MSRRKDRERFEAMKGLDPDYQGFRGHADEPSNQGKAPLESMVCTVCGRKRNVPRGVALDSGDGFVCATCIEEGRTAEADASPQPPVST
jgi:hypothetical protein